MTKFKIKNLEDAKNTVEWALNIDADGDLVLLANGKTILYISSETGQLQRACVWPSAQIDGLSFDTDGKIVLD